MDIELLRADITSIKVDAIVNPTNAPMQHVRGVGIVPVGEAVVTTGGNLLCKFVIHAVGPRMGEGDEDRKLRTAMMSALQRGEDLAIASIAFPAMSAGTFGFPFDRCARIMLGATIDFRHQARSLRRAVYCLFGPEPYDVFARVLRELQG